jgi:serine/threonine protein kinase
LLDFGAARRIIGDMNQALTVILKPSYAPPEQYAETPEVQQGAWTDIYALGAVIYCAITGSPPPPSISRVMNDSLLPLAQSAAGRYSPEFLQAIDRALYLRPENRPQSVAEWRAALFLKADWPAAKAGEISTRAPKKSPWAKIAAGLLVAAMGIAAVFMHQQQPASVDASAPAATAVTELPAPQITEIKAAEPTKLFDAIKALDQVFEQRDRDHPVTVLTDKSSVKIGRDKLRFRIYSPRAGYLYILMVGTDRSHFNLLFPNAIDPNNQVSSGKEVSLPRPGWAMTAGGPAGTNHFVALVSENPRDFSAAGLIGVDAFGEFPLEVAARIAAANARPSPFAGRPVCPSSANCSSAYGAATFSIQEVD